METPLANIFKIQRYSINDGPGIRTTIFFKGCPLRCKWCHNPEALQRSPVLMFNENLCTQCRLCYQHCPHGVHTFRNGRHRVDFSACKKCKTCLDYCIPVALSIAGERVTPDEIMEIILKDKDYYRESNGGVTFSGGEPVGQAEVVKSLIDRCAQHRISTFLDTCGYAPPEVFAKVVQKVDGILFDLKLMDSNKHKAYTGVENTLILANFKLACRLQKALFVRTVVLPGINDDMAHYSRMAKFLKENNFSGQIDLLPYHAYGHSKCSQLGLSYELTDIEPPSPEKLVQIKDFFTAQGFRAYIN